MLSLDASKIDVLSLAKNTMTRASCRREAMQLYATLKCRVITDAAVVLIGLSFVLLALGRSDFPEDTGLFPWFWGGTTLILPSLSNTKTFLLSK